MLDPKPDTTNDGYDEKKIFRNTIAITDYNNVVVFNETQTFLTKGKEFDNFIKVNSSELKKHKLYIVHYEEIKIAEIFTVIELLKKEGIDNYKVIKLETFPLAEPLAVAEPSITKTETNLYSAENFVIEMFKDSIKLHLLGKATNIKSKIELDSFISRNKKVIDKLNIYMRGKSDLVYDRFKLVKSVLKKYEYFKFQISSY